MAADSPVSKSPNTSKDFGTRQLNAFREAVRKEEAIATKHFLARKPELEKKFAEKKLEIASKSVIITKHRLMLGEKFLVI